MARPLGEISQAALDLLDRRPLTAREIAMKLQVPERTVKDICYRLTSGGHARVVDQRRVPHARRPVAVYAPRCRQPFALGAVWR